MLTTVIAVVVVLGGLIFFHELGHFAVARWLGMGVSTFSLGFGPKILKYRKGKTEYALSLVPLGGYVALVGESDPKDIPAGFTERESFALRPAWQRFLDTGPLAVLPFDRHRSSIVWTLPDAEAERVLGLLMAELPLKKAAALAAEIHGVKKNALYKYALEQQGE